MFTVRPPPRRSEYFAFAGGLNLVDPPLRMGAGWVLGSVNYEIGVETGYSRIQGYERFDGRDRPSEASYWIVPFDAGDAEVLVGEEVSNSAAPIATDPQGESLIATVVTSGSYGGADAAGHLILTRVNATTNPGGFVDDDPIYVAGVQVATVDGAPVQRGADTEALDTTYLQLAIAVTRARILPVGGAARRIRGVYLYSGATYAFQDNAGGTLCEMWKSTSAGWVKQALGRRLAFTSGGTYEIVEGDTITGASSSETAEVRRVILDSGTWSGGDAEGRLVVYSQTGAFAAENLNVGASTNVATIAGDSVDQTPPAGGKYEFVTENFFGSSATIRLYGVNGVGPAFEWDGATFVELLTGMTVDKPTHLEEHRKHLFLMFPGGSVQNSGVGTPYLWTLRSGANEFGTGYEGTGMHATPGGVLAIWDRNRTYVLYGTSNSNWVLDEHSDRSGAVEWSIQRLGRPIYLDDRGFVDLRTVQAFGDFQDAVIADKIRPLVQRQKDKVTYSAIRREKNQYRIFFSDKTAIFITFRDGKVAGAMSIVYGAVVLCITSEEDLTGRERVYFGSDDGFVYEADRGTSFDGAVIPADLRLVFWHFRSPDVQKRFRRVSFEVQNNGVSSLQFTPDFNYGNSEIAQARTDLLNVRGGGGLWNQVNWNEFDWNTATIPLAVAKIDGSGLNLGMQLHSESAVELPHTIYGATVMYHFRRQMR
jgi:hypothetical protein